MTHDKLPICATVTSEIEIAAMGRNMRSAALRRSPPPYFQAIDNRPQQRRSSNATRAFVKDPKAVTHHALESSYFQILSCGAGGRESRR